MSVAEIGRRLKKARLDAKLTQKEVADKLGITYQAISNYERGTNRVDTDTLSRLCKIYGIAISDLLSTPAWTSEMFDAYRSAKSDSERERCRFRESFREAVGFERFVVDDDFSGTGRDANASGRSFTATNGDKNRNVFIH